LTALLNIIQNKVQKQTYMKANYGTISHLYAVCILRLEWGILWNKL